MLVQKDSNYHNISIKIVALINYNMLCHTLLDYDGRKNDSVIRSSIVNSLEHYGHWTVIVLSIPGVLSFNHSRIAEVS